MKTLLRHRLDAFLVALAILVGVAVALSDNAHRYLAALLAAAALLTLLARRRRPVLVSLVALALLGSSLAAAPHSPSAQFFALMATFAVVAAVNNTRHGIVAGAFGVAVLAAATFGAAPENALGDFLLTLGFCTIMWGAGWLISRHTRRADVMALRAQAAEQAQALALRDERARIARELHDVVSHGLSVVVLQTLAARTARDAGDLPDLDRHLDAVESTARDALAEMRRMLGLLQVGDLDPDDAATPSPGLRHVPALVDRARAVGLRVDDSGLNPSVVLSAGRELTVYRIVQEALTNAAKHAPGANVTITLGCDGAAATVEVSNGRGTARPVDYSVTLGGGGHGLVGMRERVAIYQGSLDAFETGDGGFTVHARLPVEQIVSTGAGDGRR